MVLSSFFVFLLSVWQAEDLPILAQGLGGWSRFGRHLQCIVSVTYSCFVRLIIFQL
jgi:hypothetical protein